MTKSGTILVLPEPGLAGLPWLRERIASLPGSMPGPVAALCPAPESDLLASVLADLPGLGVTPYEDGNLTGSRPDLDRFRVWFRERVHAGDGTAVFLVDDPGLPGSRESFHAFLRLVGVREAAVLGPDHEMPLDLPPAPRRVQSVLIRVRGGIGNVILATPLVRAAINAGLETLFCPLDDVRDQSLAPLFSGIPRPGPTLLTPSEADNTKADLRLNVNDREALAPGDFFHSPHRTGLMGSEARAMARFLENITGLKADPSATFAGGDPEAAPERLCGRIVVCPGSKPGWEPKRWPHMDALLRALRRAHEEAVVLCRPADLEAYAATDFLTPITAPAEYATDLDLASAAAVLRTARAVVANDCGLAHVAAAVDAPTLVLFGPSSLAKNAQERPNVRNLSLELPCQPCQGATGGPGRLAPGQYSCDLGYACLAELGPETVLTALDELAGGAVPRREGPKKSRRTP